MSDLMNLSKNFYHERGELRNPYHIDEGLLYKTTRVIVRRGIIVGFRALITAGRQRVENKTPVHIADVQSMTEEFLRRLRKKPVSHDGDGGGGKSTVGQGVTLFQLKPKTPSEKGRSPSAEPASVMALGVYEPRGL